MKSFFTRSSVMNTNKVVHLQKCRAENKKRKRQVKLKCFVPHFSFDSQHDPKHFLHFHRLDTWLQINMKIRRQLISLTIVKNHKITIPKADMLRTRECWENGQIEAACGISSLSLRWPLQSFHFVVSE